MRTDSKTEGRSFTGIGAHLLVFLALLVLLNVAIHRSASSSQRQRLLQKIAQMSKETKFVFLGNSLMEAGFDAEAFSESTGGHGDFEMLALGGTSPVEHNLILRQALGRAEAVKLIVYGFFDDQLFSKPSGNWSDLVGNRALSCYFPREAANYYDPGSALKRWQLEITGAVPMLGERSSLWAKVEQFRRRFEDFGMPAHQVNRFGRVEDFSALEAADAASFSKRCDAALGNKNGFSAPVNDMLEMAQRAGETLVLVEMPMPSRHRNLFYSADSWQALARKTRELAVAKNCVYLPASEWIAGDRMFEDTTHLNPEGAKLFTRRLAKELHSISIQNEKTAVVANR
jgi:hypothetical protein